MGVWKFEVFLLAVTTSLRLVSMTDYLSDSAYLINSLREHHFSGCVFLAHASSSDSDFRSRTTMVRLRKYLTDLNVSTSVIHLRDYAYFYDDVNCNHNSAFYVILDSNELVRSILCELTAEQIFSAYLWLIFLTEGQVAEEYLKCATLAFPAEFLVAEPLVGRGWKISEVYRVPPGGSLQRNWYGAWKGPEVKVHWPTLELYQRRSNLQGRQFHAAIFYMYDIDSERKLAQSEPTRYFENIWKTLEVEKNFSTVFLQTDDPQGGFMLADGSWTGLMGSLNRCDAEVGVSLLAMNSQRARAVKFLYPLLQTRFYAVVQQESTPSVGWRLYLSPFSGKLWFLVLLNLLGTTFLLTVLQRCGQSVGTEDHGRSFSVGDSLICVFGIWCQQGLVEQLHSWPCRQAALALLYGVMVVSAAYSAKLVSSLAVQRREMPFSQLTDLLDQTYYHVGLVKHSQAYWLFSSSEDPVLQKLYRRLLKDDNSLQLLLSSDASAIERVCVDKSFVLVSAGVGLFSRWAQAQCPVLTIPLDISRVTVSIAVTRKSPFINFFNYNLQVLSNAGILSRLGRPNYEVQEQREFVTPPEGSNTVDLGDVAPLLAVVVVGVALSLITLILEMVYNQFKLCGEYFDLS